MKGLSDEAYRHDAVILGGDVSDRFDVLEETLAHFVSKFTHVFFTPGNHDLWCRRSKKGGGAGVGDAQEPEFTDSAHKLESIFQMCDRLGVHTTPRLIGSGSSSSSEGASRPVWIAPVLSW